MDKKKLDKIIHQIKKGQDYKFKKILDAYGKRIYGYIHSITKNSNHVDDLYQDTIIKIYTSIQHYDPSGNFEAWIITIARNTVYDGLRKLNKIIYLEDLNDLLSDAHFEMEILKKESLIELDQCIASLKEEQQEMIYLKYFSDYSYEDIAKHMNVEVKRVKWQLYEARKALLSNNEMRRLHDEM